MTHHCESEDKTEDHCATIIARIPHGSLPDADADTYETVYHIADGCSASIKKCNSLEW